MKVLRLARAITDLSGSERLMDEALWEAMTMKRPKLENQIQRRTSY